MPMAPDSTVSAVRSMPTADMRDDDSQNRQHQIQDANQKRLEGRRQRLGVR